MYTQTLMGSTKRHDREQISGSDEIRLGYLSIPGVKSRDLRQGRCIVMKKEGERGKELSSTMRRQNPWSRNIEPGRAKTTRSEESRVEQCRLEGVKVLLSR